MNAPHPPPTPHPQPHHPPPHPHPTTTTPPPPPLPHPHPLYFSPFVSLDWLGIPRFNWSINTLRPRQNGRCFADDTFTRIFLNENVRISITISLKFVPQGPINNNSALVQIMAWRRSGDKPLSESMMASLLTHICVTRPQWVNEITR